MIRKIFHMFCCCGIIFSSLATIVQGESLTDAANLPVETEENTNTAVNEEIQENEQTPLIGEANPTTNLETNEITDGEITVGNIKYFLSAGEIDYSYVYENDILVRIQEYYPGSKVENAENQIQYIFELDVSQNITKATRLNLQDQKPNTYFQYYPNTTYGIHDTNILYMFSLNSLGYITEASKREKGTQRILSWYQYYPNAVYGSHGNNIKYVFDVNSSNYVTTATKREQGTKRIIARYNYYPGTLYGQHGKNISYIYNFNSEGFLTSATRREKGTQKILSWYKYYSNTLYSNRGINIEYIFNSDTNGYVSKAWRRAKSSKRVITEYDYYDYAIYGKHGLKIKEILNFNSDGYIINSMIRKDNSSIVINAKEYYPYTTKINQNANIKYWFDIQDTGLILAAYLKEKNTQDTIGYYNFYSGTQYGKHWSQVSRQRLYVQKIRQNPELPWGCAIVSLTQALNYKGHNLDKIYMANSIPYSNDPYKGYVGSPFRSQQGDPNLIYPEGLIGTAKKYQPNSQVINGITEEQIKTELQKGNPILVWVVWNFLPVTWRWYYSGPNALYAPSSYHVIVLTGYDELGNYTYTDPAGSLLTSTVTKSKFNEIFNDLGRRAIVVR